MATGGVTISKDESEERRSSLQNIEEEFKKLKLETFESVKDSRFHNDFEIVKVLGEGGFAKVFQVMDRKKQQYATKRIHLKGKEKNTKYAKREVEILAKLSHKNIVEIHDFWFEKHPTSWLKDKEKAMDLTSSSESQTASSNEVYKLINQHQHTSIISRDDRSDSIDSSRSSKYSGYEADVSSISVSSRQYSTSEDSARIPNEETDDSAPTFELDLSIEGSKGGQQIASSESSSLQIDFGYSGRQGGVSLIEEQLEVKRADTEIYLYIKMELCLGKKQSVPEEHTEDALSLKGRLLGDDRNLLDQKSVFTQLIDALEYIHNKDVIHRDLKPSNIFFAEDPVTKVETLKLGDFGLARFIREENGENFNHMSPDVGTTCYRSPEMKEKSNDYSKATDIFSLGVIFFEIFYPLKTGQERSEVLEKLTESDCCFPDDVDSHLTGIQKRLITLMLSRDEAQRPNICEIKGGELYQNMK